MKRLLVAIVGLLLFAPFTAGAFSGQGCAGDCRDCHKLEQKEAEAIVRKVAPSGRVVDVKMSPVKSLWQIDIEADGGKRSTLYVDFSKEFLVTGRIVPISEIGQPAPQRRIDFSGLPLKDAVVMGPGNAKKKVVVFDDPDCPFCRKLHEEIKLILAKRNDVAFYIILNPLPMHKDAYKKVQAILCEKSISLLDDAFKGKALPEPDCSNEQVEKNIALAKSLGLTGTPMLVREDGTVLPGYLPADKLTEWIDAK